MLAGEGDAEKFLKLGVVFDDEDRGVQSGAIVGGRLGRGSALRAAPRNRGRSVSTLFEHGERLADAWRSAEEDLELPARGATLFLLDLGEQCIWIRTIGHGCGISRGYGERRRS